MSSILYPQPLNWWWKVPVGEFVPVSDRGFVIRVTKCLDHRTPVKQGKRQKFRAFDLISYYTDVGELVGWRLQLKRRSKALFGSCLYVPATKGGKRRSRRVRRLVQLDGLVVVLYTDGSVLLYYRGRVKEPRYKRNMLYGDSEDTCVGF